MAERTVPEHIRSVAWATAKPVALEEWNKGSADTTQMLIAASRALDAALAELWGRGLVARPLTNLTPLGGSDFSAPHASSEPRA